MNAPAPSLEIPGEQVAELFEQLNALLAPAGAWTQGAWARDADNEKLTTPVAIREQAVCRCLLGGVEAVSPDVALQMAMTKALTDALQAFNRQTEAHGAALGGGRYFAHLSAFNDHVTQREVLRLIAAAQTISLSNSWPRWQKPTLPGRPPTPAETADLHLELQLLGEMFFAGSDPYAGQYSATASIDADAAAREKAIGEYLTVHHDIVQAHLSAGDV